MRAYSIDLRQKVVESYDRGVGSQQQIAENFGVSRSFVEKLLQRRRTTGDIAPLPQGGGVKPALGAEALALVRQLVKEEPDATLEELCEAVHRHRGVRVSLSNMCTRLKHMGLPRKKKSLQATERDSLRVKQARQEFSRTIFKTAPKRLKFIDESGVNLSMTRMYGRAPKGERVVGSVPGDHGPNVTMVGSMGLEGISAAMSFEGPMNGAVFKVFVEQVLSPTLLEGDVVVMDNLRAHKVKGIEQAIESRGATLVYLPPYSPDFSPIEGCWSKVKTGLRKAKARTVEALDRAIEHALGEVTSSDAKGWFKHCGYAIHTP